MTLFRLTVAVALGAMFASPALAQKKYDIGATDTEIKVGQTIPLSGPASAYGSIGKVQAAYIRMVNEQGGINGRKINLIQYDDAYTPRFRNISTTKKCRSFWPRRGRPASPTQRISHGP